MNTFSLLLCPRRSLKIILCMVSGSTPLNVTVHPCCFISLFTYQNSYSTLSVYPSLTVWLHLSTVPLTFPQYVVAFDRAILTAHAGKTPVI